MNDIIRCSNCKLNQFRTKSGVCRKCHHSFNQLSEKPVIYMQPTQPASSIGVLQSFGLAFKLIRLSKELSQRELSQRVNCPRTFISRIERGGFHKRGLRWSYIEILIHALGVSAHQFFLLVDALNG